MNIVIATTGTGGDLFPGIAVAEELRKGGHRMLFVVSGEQAAGTVRRAGYDCETMTTGRLMGEPPVRQLMTLAGLPARLLRSRRLLRRFGADAVLGLGGHSSGPVVIAGCSLGLPAAILEKNAVAGLTNRLLASFVRRVYTFFPQANASFPAKKVLWTGVPIRAELKEVPPKTAGIFTVLALGGSQGAASINRAMLEAYPSLGPIRVIHQTGGSDYENVRQRYRALGAAEAAVRVFPFIEKMEEAYAEADYVISRAGASTLAELVAVRRASLLIPYPHAADDHQRKNALWMVQQGGAELMRDRELCGEALAQRILHHQADRTGLEAMQQALSRLSGRDAAEVIAKEIRELARGV